MLGVSKGSRGRGREGSRTVLALISNISNYDADVNAVPNSLHTAFSSSVTPSFWLTFSIVSGI